MVYTRIGKYDFLIEVKRKAKFLGRFNLTMILEKMELRENTINSVKCAVKCLEALGFVRKDRGFKRNVYYNWVDLEPVDKSVVF